MRRPLFYLRRYILNDIKMQCQSVVTDAGTSKNNAAEERTLSTSFSLNRAS